MLDRGTTQTMLITSANLSTSAWGIPQERGGLMIRNFELGVAIANAQWPFDGLEPFDDFNDAATCKDVPVPPPLPIQWAEARWDGRHVCIEGRLVERRAVDAVVFGQSTNVPVVRWQWNAEDSSCKGTVRWEDAEDHPLFVELACGEQQIEIPVTDDRPRDVLDALLPSEVDPLLAQQIIDQLIFEKYGGRMSLIDEDSESVSTPEELVTDDDDPELKDSYAVPAFVLARRALRIVATWAHEAATAAERGHDSFEMQQVLQDGNVLQRALLREADRNDRTGDQLGIGARVAAQELSLRLEAIA